MPKIFVKPSPGLKIKDPQTGHHLPEGGKEVEESSFWIRRIVVKDVIQVEQGKEEQDAQAKVYSQLKK